MGNDPKKIKSPVISVLLAVGVFAIFQILIMTEVLDSYMQGLLLLILINMLLALSLNIATGFLGELCLGHAGFMAIGAYTAALMTKNVSWPIFVSFPLALLLAMAVAGLAGFLIGLPALRLKGDYLAIITLAFGEIVRIVIRSLPFTGGALGLNGIRRVLNFPIMYVAYVLSLVVILRFMFSRHGRAILAIREDEIAAEASGIPTFRYKMIAFVMSAMFAGLAGGLFAHYQGNLAPEKFDYNYSIDIMVMVVFGGMGSITGSIIAAIILTLLPEVLRGLDNYRMLIYAVMLIVLMIFRPEGMFGRKELTYSLLQKWTGRFFKVKC